MAEYKIKCILEWPEPRKVKDIQSFLGFANFYRHFINNYSTITIPLTRLTWKGLPWNFTEDCRESFNKLKQAFTFAPILTHWTPDCPLIVETDASDYVLAAILSQTVNSTLCPFTPELLLCPNLITTFMAKSFWLYSRHSNIGDTTWKDQQIPSMSSQIT